MGLVTAAASTIRIFVLSLFSRMSPVKAFCVIQRHAVASPAAINDFHLVVDGSICPICQL